MLDYTLNRFDLTQYGLLRAEVIEIDERIREVEEELAELNKYNVNISPVYSGMPSGNGMTDKIGDFVVQLNNNINKSKSELETLTARRTASVLKLQKIRIAVNQISNKQLRSIIKWYFFDGKSTNDIADEIFLSTSAIQQRIYRFFKFGAIH